MKLCYPLPEAEGRALAARDPSRLLYAIPYDVEGGELTNGLFAATEQGMYRLAGGEVCFACRYTAGASITVEERHGTSALMQTDPDGTERELCRFTSRCAPRFFAILSALTALSCGERPREEENGDPELSCPRCGRPFPPHTGICPFCSRTRSAASSLLAATRGMRLMLLFPLLVSAVTLAIRFLVPILQKDAINRFLYPQDGVARGTAAQFLTVVLALIVFDLISRVLAVINTRLSGIAGNRFDVRLRTLLFRKVESLSLSTVNRRSVAYLSERINGDVATIRDFLINRVPTVFSQLLGLVVGTVLILSISPLMSLMIVIPLPFAMLVFILTRGPATKRAQHLRQHQIRYFRTMHDTLSGARVTKLFGQEEAAGRRYADALAGMEDTDRRGKTFAVLNSHLLLEIIELGSYLILFFGNLWLFHGTLDAGTVNQFSAYSGIFYEPLRQFTELPSEIAAFTTALSHVRELLDEEAEVKDAEDALEPPIHGSIHIENAVFGYNAYAPILRGVTLDIKAGEMIGIVGRSGCGKTTLVNLIMRLYDTGRGRIEIDGVDVRRISQRHLRSHIGLVPQEVQLFEGTVRDNIRFSRPDAEDREIVAAARAAGAHDFILSLPEGYNTRVGERGSTLSGGERQRIAIARALLHDPKILILDEATAALDAETERDIQAALDRLTQGRTTIAIAHRLSTLRNADRIVVIDGGRVVEQGSHAELIAARGHYYKLVMAQASLAQAGISEEV